MKSLTVILRIHACMLAMVLSNSMASETGISATNDFQVVSTYASKRKLPIMVLFSSIYCDYCEFVKEEYLAPMIKSGEYTDKVVIRVVEIDGSDDVRDFNGKLIDPEELGDRYNIQFTPTVAFMDSQGHELGKRIVGIGTEDYYGSFLDEGINTSLSLINTVKQEVMQ